jgi:hypothetical protein
MIDVALPVYLMLTAYAVENILKGMLVLENGSTYEQCVNLHLKLPPALKGHDLAKLAEATCSEAAAYAYRRDLLRRFDQKCSLVWYILCPWRTIAASQRSRTLMARTSTKSDVYFAIFGSVQEFRRRLTPRRS